MGGLVETAKQIGGAMLPYAGDAMSLTGTFLKARGYKDAGRAAREAAEYEAAQLDQNSVQSVAAAQRVALDRRREAERVRSRAIALAAAGGGGVTDPTVVNLLAGISGEGEYRAAAAMYEGESQARTFRMKAAATRYTGAATEQAYKTMAKSAYAQGGSSLFAKYAKPLPNDDAPSALSDDDWGMDYQSPSAPVASSPLDWWNYGEMQRDFLNQPPYRVI